MPKPAVRPEIQKLREYKTAVILLAKDVDVAGDMAWLYEEFGEYETPWDPDDWRRSLLGRSGIFPLELYFPFKTRSAYANFMRAVVNSFGKDVIVENDISE